MFINTAYNCIARVSPVHSFETVWKPDFISSIVAEDRCHLNGMARQGGKIGELYDVAVVPDMACPRSYGFLTNDVLGIITRDNDQTA